MKIAIVGYGKMGHMIERVADSRGHEIVARFDIDNNLNGEGLTAEKLVSGEADLAIQQISELIMVKGVDLVGPLPPEVASVTGFSAAVLHSSPRQEQARQLVQALSSADAMKAYAAAGLSPRQ